MKIEASVSLLNTTPSAIVEHNGQTLEFSISLYRRTVFSQQFDIFSQINRYWADQSPTFQQEVFNIYRNIFNSFDEVYNNDQLKEYLKEQITTLLRMHDLDRIQEWVAFRCHDIKLPNSIKEEFVEDVDRNLSLAKTYLGSDYRKLSTLSLVLRCMIPIWGEYISSIKQDVDDSFKETMAFQLVDKVLNPELPVIKKLIEYITETITSSNITRQIEIFKGIPVSDYPRWLLSLICIRCLAIGDIRGVNQDAHLVTYIHMYISHKLSSKAGGSDESRIKDKGMSNEDTEDGRSSALERYKVKSNISICDIVENEFMLDNHEFVANKLAPGIDFNIVKEAIERSMRNTSFITKPQTTLLRMLFSSIAPPEIILYLPEQNIKQFIGIMESVLWHRGHHYLSILSSCQPITSENEMVVSPMDSKMRIPESLALTLDKLFPYRQNQRSKKTGAKETNMAMESIDLLTNDFTKYGWKPTVDGSKIESVLGYKTNRFIVKPDIKTDLAKLVIEIETSSYLNTSI